MLSIFMVESIIAEDDEERFIGSDLNIVETADAFFFLSNFAGQRLWQLHCS